MKRSSRTSRIVLRNLLVLLLICSIFPSIYPVHASEQQHEFLIGIEPEHNIFDQMERYRYLADYLSVQLGTTVKLTIMSRYGEVLKRFKTLKLDGAILTPYAATMAITELGWEPLASPVHLDGQSTSEGYLFVRKDSGISSFRDMKGRNIVFVDPATMEGYLFPLSFLQQHGIGDIDSFFSRYFFSGSHSSAIFAVLDGRADIGAAKNRIYNDMISSDPSIQQELEILARSPKVPEITLCLKSEIDPDLQQRLRTILVHMDKTPEGIETLQKLGASGFTKTDKEDFVIIESMAQETLGSLTVLGK
jgi:phosphonate transport system substrate-binding protein